VTLKTEGVIAAKYSALPSQNITIENRCLKSYEYFIKLLYFDHIQIYKFPKCISIKKVCLDVFFLGYLT